MAFAWKNIPSINSQCPVRTQTHTINKDNEKENNSAPVNRPHMPKDILKIGKWKKSDDNDYFNSMNGKSIVLLT